MSRTKKIALTGIMIAINVVANYIASFFTVRIGIFGTPSLVYCTAFLSGIWLGPILGGLAALVGDLIPAFLFPTGIWIWQISLSSLLMGVFAGLFWKMPIKKDWIKLALMGFVTLVVCSLCLNSWGLSTYMFDRFPSAQARGERLGVSNPFLIIVIARAITQPFWIAINLILVFFIQLYTKNVTSLYLNNKSDKASKIITEEDSVKT